ncbi:MAG: PAS domain S-box protein [Candidatus Delongbacteria bacterium]|jgi:PAS domain S-box-containing protein|nr:PAS domain S-box protein [Candidatus Delongbacteria bacterium]
MKKNNTNNDIVDENYKPNKNYFLYLIIFAIEIIGIIIYASWKNQEIFHEEVVEKAFNELLVLSENISINIKSHFDEGISQLNKLTEKPEFIDLVKKKIKNTKDEDLENYLTLFFENYSENINSIILYDAEGNIITQISDSSTVYVSDDEDEIDLNNNGSDNRNTISKMLFSKNNDPIIAIDNKFFEDDQFLGILRIEINLNYLENYVFPASMFDYKSNCFIMDQSGMIVYHDSKRAIGKNARFLSKNPNKNIEGEDYTNFINILQKGEKGTGIFEYAWWLDNVWEKDKKLCAFYPLELDKNTWMIINSLSYYELAKPYIINSMYTYGIAGLLLITFTILIIIIFYLMKKRIIYKTKLAFLEKLRASTEELDKSSQKFKDLFEVNTTAICTVSPTDYISDCNGRFCELTGFSEEEVNGKMKWQDIISDHDLERILDYDNKRKEDADAAPNEYEFELKRKDGSFRNVLLTVRVLGETSEQLASVIDITSIKKVEKELRNNQYNLKKAQEMGKIGNWELDFKNNILKGSDEFYVLTGLKPDNNNQIALKELLGILVTPKKMIRDILRLLRNGYSFDSEYYIKSENGKRNKIFRSIAQLIEENDQPSTIQGVIQDITESKEIEIEIMNTNNNLKNMMYVASHDLQMPLVSMEGFASMMLEEYSEVLDDKGQYFLKRILSNTSSMRKLINSLLSISRLSSVENPFEEVDMVKVISIVKKELEISLQESNVELFILDKENIPKTFGDKQRLLIVLRNLISNSINYKAKNISIGYENEKGYFVKDDGIGINKDHLERIFKPGERINDIKTEGTGMGLTFCQKVIEMHKGNIWAESEGRGEGMTIYFTVK